MGRNAILIEGLRAQGIPVSECHAEVWRDTEDKMSTARGLGPLALPGLLRRQAVAWRRLARRATRLGPADVILVGPTAHLDLPLARLLADRWGAALVFDPLISAEETVRDRGLLPPGSARLRALSAAERALFRLPDTVLVDTEAHGRALGAALGLPAERWHRLPVGAPTAFGACPAYRAEGRGLRVLYCGQFIPLHGVEVILLAAARLRHRPDIRFELVGQGQTLPAARALAARLDLRNVRFVETWLPPETLAARHLAPADLCLGIFGTTPKAAHVVPMKVFAGLAAGRPVLSADTPALRELLTPDREVAAVPPGDPAALAAALEALADAPARRAALAAAGRTAWERRFAPAPLGRALLEILEDPGLRPASDLGPRHRWRSARLARALEDAAPEGAVLDAGCGPGTAALSLAGEGRCVLAFDRAPRRVARTAAAARRAGRSARVLAFRADLRALPLADESVAGALAGEVLEHVEEDEAALRELARVLRPSGALALTVPADPARFGPADRAAGHARRYRRSRLRRGLHAAGLRPERIESWGFPFGRIYDRLVQRPSMAPRARRARPLLARMGRLRVVDGLWRMLFDLDARWEAGPAADRGDAGRGSGWLAVARKGEPLPTRSRGGRAEQTATPR